MAPQGRQPRGLLPPTGGRGEDGIDLTVEDARVGRHVEVGAEEQVDVALGVHVVRSAGVAIGRSSASTLARSARIARCRRDFMVPLGMPRTDAASAIGRSR